MNNIEADVVCMYNHEMSTHYYKENFSVFETNYRGHVTKLIYIDYGNIDQPTIRDLIEINKNSKRSDLLVAIEDLTGLSNFDLLRDEIIEELYAEANSIDDLEISLDRAGVKYKKNYISFSSQGYSQGDSVDVIMPTKALRNAWGTSDKIKDIDLVEKQFIDNLLWDSPIYFRITLYLNNSTHHFHGDDFGIPIYWNYPFCIDDAKEMSLKYIRDKFKNAAAVDIIVDAVDNAFPLEIKY